MRAGVGAGLRGKTDNLSGEGARQDMIHPGDERPAPTVGEADNPSGAWQDVTNPGGERPAPTLKDLTGLPGSRLDGKDSDGDLSGLNRRV